LASVGGLLAFTFNRQLLKVVTLIIVLDAAGLSLFAVTGAATAVTLGLGPAQAVLLGVITGAGGGTIRDMMLAQIPSVLVAAYMQFLPSLRQRSPSPRSALVFTEFRPRSLPPGPALVSGCSECDTIGTHPSHPIQDTVNGNLE
jgi:hypothetical protein